MSEHSVSRNAVHTLPVEQLIRAVIQSMATLRLYAIILLLCASGSRILEGMNRLPIEDRARIVAALVEGNSIRSVCRMTGFAKRTVTRLLVEVGSACFHYQDRVLHNLKCKRLQCDEIWSFIGCKQKNVTPAKAETGIVGDAWVWVAIDADTKLVPCWLVGKRDAGCATEFIADLEGRLTHRVQLTTDGHKSYLNAVIDAFADDIDYAMLVKVFNADAPGESRYSPAAFIATEKVTILGDPDLKHVSTSYVERQNLTMRMGMRRFTRLTNGFSKKIENHEAAVALHYMHYNFARIHQTLRITPAMAAGVSCHVWSYQEIVALADAKIERKAA
jgi:IS1 family transposase